MNKKTLIIIIILIIAIAITVFLLWKNKDKNSENNVIQPQEETTDEQMRTALVTLYYVNKETKELTPEGRMIDVKSLCIPSGFATVVGCQNTHCCKNQLFKIHCIFSVLHKHLCTGCIFVFYLRRSFTVT